MTIFPLISKLEKYFGKPANGVSQGEVAIVGAGPGDLGLLTVKALHLLQQAEVIFYDYLVSEEILAMASKSAEMIPVGKRAGNHSVPQDQINQLLVDHALQGKRVCRLKGGDPFIFGRGGEEVETLATANVPFQIVPGITAASGCTAYAGIPLTHRDYAQSVQVVTGHSKEDGKEPDWSTLAQENQTLVVYMGKMRASHISQQLISHGAPSERRVAIIENGTAENQRVVTGELANLSNLVAVHNIGSPALIVIGDVVKLADQLAWFNQTPDAGLAGELEVVGQ